METVYVIDSVRTPIGKYGGALSSIRPDDLLALVIKALIGRNKNIDVNSQLITTCIYLIQIQTLN
jgi:acetyl-CoA acetyltransferase